MNFFGHSVVASSCSTDYRFLLGSMLPDLCAILGIRVIRAQDAAISAGIDFHHKTDAAFHGCTHFVALCSRSVEALTADGVGRGTARAVAHVGAELLLDGVLSVERGARATYSGALTRALDEELCETLSAPEEDRVSLQRGLTRLLQAPIPEAYRDPGFVAERLQTMLARRPRLSMQPHDLPAVSGEIQRLSSQIAVIWPELMSQVGARLAP